MNTHAIAIFEKLQEADVVMVKGPAGSGKTTLIKQIVAESRRLERDCLLMAPTGRAAKVLTDRTGQKALTIHKCIYGEVDLEEHFDASGDSSTYKWIFAQKSNPMPANSVLIVDEASMISDIFTDEERMRFGSGYLLTDLMRFADLKATNNQYKLILVGDPYQLPPVGSNHSPALDKAYLERKFQMKVDELLLTTIYRQAKGNAIFQNAGMLRQALEAKDFSSFKLDYSEDVQRLEPSDFVRHYDARTQCKVDPGVLVVAHSNQVVRNYNHWIRSLLFPGAKELVVGDILLVTQNNYAPDTTKPDESLYNGEFVEILELFPGIETEQGVLRRKGEIISHAFRFQKAKIKVRPDGEVLTVRLMLDLLDSPEPGLTDDQSDALYVNFRMRNSHLKPQTPEFIDAIHKDPYLNSLKVKFGYAVTCHKAQGGEWHTVFVDYKYHGGYTNEAFFRWAYTALTRAKVISFSMESPEYTAMTGSRLVEGNVRPCERFSDVKSLVLGTLKELEILTEEVISHSYTDFYRVRTGEISARIKVTYNKNLEITNVMTECKNPALEGDLPAKLRASLLGRRAGGIGETCAQPELPEDPRMSDKQKIIEQKILRAAKLCGIVVAERHVFSKYQFRYLFKKESEFCEADYYTNEKGLISRIVQGKTSPEGAELIKWVTMRYE